MLDSTPGAVLSALLGVDGLGVEVVFNDGWSGADRNVLEIELAALAEGLLRADGQFDVTVGEEFFLGTGKVNFVGAMLAPDYFIVLGLAPDGDLAQAWGALAEGLQAFQGMDAPDRVLQNP
jgi:hypothetical protein